MPDIRLTELMVKDPPEGWRAAGFEVDADGVCRVGQVAIRVERPTAGERDGIAAWGLTGIETGQIDGLPTFDAALRTHQPPDHPNGVRSVDHVVVWTPDNPRTTRAIQDAGLRLRRTREADEYGAPMVQTFFRAGEVVIEVIGPPAPDDPAAATKPARFFGLAYTVTDIDATARALGDHLGRIKSAVQPGRRIATLRHTDLGMSVATAFLSA